MTTISLASTAFATAKPISIHELHNALACAAKLVEGREDEEISEALADPGLEIYIDEESAEGCEIDVEAIKAQMAKMVAA